MRLMLTFVVETPDDFWWPDNFWSDELQSMNRRTIEGYGYRVARSEAGISGDRPMNEQEVKAKLEEHPSWDEPHEMNSFICFMVILLEGEDVNCEETAKKIYDKLDGDLQQNRCCLRDMRNGVMAPLEEEDE